MLYRHLPKLANTEISVFTLSVEDRAQDEVTTALIDSAIEAGCTHIFTGTDREAYLYTRSHLRTSTRTGNGHVTLIAQFTGDTAEDLVRFMDTLKPVPGDILLLPALSSPDIHLMRSAGTMRLLEDTASQGINWGFSCEGSVELASAALNTKLPFCCWHGQFNYLRTELLPVLEQAGEQGVVLLAADPFAGGLLENPPAAVHEIFSNAPVPRSKDEWALRAILERQEVASIVWKAPNMPQLQRKIIFLEAARANSLPRRELEVIEAAAKAIREV